MNQNFVGDLKFFGGLGENYDYALDGSAAAIELSFVEPDCVTRSELRVRVADAVLSATIAQMVDLENTLFQAKLKSGDTRALGAFMSGWEMAADKKAIATPSADGRTVLFQLPLARGNLARIVVPAHAIDALIEMLRTVRAQATSTGPSQH